MSLTKIQIESFIGELDRERRAFVEQLAATIALQAEVIQELKIQLDMFEGTEALMEKSMSGVALMTLAGKLTDPKIQAPTINEISSAIKKMQADIRTAQSSQKVLSTILSFATKVTPLIIP